jgi:multidrug resistance efflux pump
VEYDKAMNRHWEPQEVHDAYAKALWHAEQDLALAQAELTRAGEARTAHELGLELLAAQRDTAAKELTYTLKMGTAYTTTLALLQADAGRAQLELDGLRAWQNPYLDPPSPEGVVKVRASLRQAELAVHELEWQMAGAELRAPFDGVVSAVFFSPGEWASAGTPVVELLDTSGWRVETRNVGELEIGQVHVGQEAVVRVNALPGQSLRGRITAISPVAVVQQGDTTYTLMIELEPIALNLRPGMTAQVEIITLDD